MKRMILALLLGVFAFSIASVAPAGPPPKPIKHRSPSTDTMSTLIPPS